jgi:hypothetical protein
VFEGVEVAENVAVGVKDGMVMDVLVGELVFWLPPLLDVGEVEMFFELHPE